jgi:hypothetical protein
MIEVAVTETERSSLSEIDTEQLDVVDDSCRVKAIVEHTSGCLPFDDSLDVVREAVL